MSTGQVQINILAKDKTGGAFKSAVGNFSKLGKIAGGLAVGGIAAVGAGAITALGDFVTFQDGMNEVFTLLPGVSGDAMDAMQDQVKDLSKKMGVLPDDVVPALYQALSAGVSQDNVFDFLETAQKAATGGITDLETAVDGITSTVNAFGSDVINAADASDVMFTAVRLGKTSFEELSANLSNVNPLASALGVEFSDVGAALATMTAQGTGTAQSTTQLRSLMQELSKEGSKVAGVFEKEVGASFTEFIANGNNMGDAMEVLQNISDDTGKPIQDMFSSVEAGSAALKLTGKGFDSFTANIKESADASGATDSAFDTMSGGIQKTIDKIKANAKVAFLDVGDALSPMLDKLVEMSDWVLPLVSDGISYFVEILDGLFGMIGEGMSPMDTLIEGLWNVAPPELLQALINLRDNVLPPIINWFSMVWEVVQPLIDQAKEFIVNFVSVKDVLIALGIILGVVVLSAIISVVAAMAPLILTVVAIIAVVALVRNAWENNWGGIQEKTAVVIAFIRKIIVTVFNFIKSFWLKNGDAIKTKALEVWDFIYNTIEIYINLVWNVIQFVMDAVREFWENNGESIMTTAREVWAFIVETITTKINNIRETIEFVLNKIKEFWDKHGEKIIETAKAVWEDIKKRIKETVDTIKKIIKTFQDLVEGGWEGFGDKLKLLWRLAWTIIKNKIIEIKGQIITAIETMVTALKQKLSNALDNIKRKFAESFDGIATKVEAGVLAINNILQAATNLWNWLKSKVFTVKLNVPSFPSLPGFASGGSIAKNQLSIIGEKGPELFMPNQSGTIIPNHKLSNFGGNGRNSSSKVTNYNITAQYDYRPEVDVLHDIRSLQLLGGG